MFDLAVVRAYDVFPEAPSTHHTIVSDPGRAAFNSFAVVRFSARSQWRRGVMPRPLWASFSAHTLNPDGFVWLAICVSVEWVGLCRSFPSDPEMARGYPLLVPERTGLSDRCMPVACGRQTSAVARRRRPTIDRKVDDSSWGEAGPRQRLAESLTVGKNRRILVTGPKAQSPHSELGFGTRQGQFQGQEWGQYGCGIRFNQIIWAYEDAVRYRRREELQRRP